jgi:hypothetical protein
MAGLPEKAAATRSSRKSPLVSGSPCLDNTCCRSSGRSRMFKLGFGLGWGFGPLQESPLRRPLSHVWVSIAHYCFFLLFFLFCIFVVVFVSAPASASICSLSLSLSLLPQGFPGRSPLQLNVGDRKRSCAFDTVWPSATKMGTGLTIPSILSLAPQCFEKPL